MNRVQLLRVLQQHDIINNDMSSLNVRFMSKLNKLPELAMLIVEATSFLLYSAPIKARVHCLFKNITSQPTCRNCHQPVEMRLNGVYRYTFPNYCSSQCSSNTTETKNKRKKTNIEKYGVDNPSKSKRVREKVEKTNTERYGVNSPLKNKQIREKVKQTNIERYGVDNPLKSKQIREKVEKTNIEKYGVKNVFELSDFQQKATDSMLEKYGVGHALQLPKIREQFTSTMLEKYGVEHAHQSSKIREKYNNTMLERFGDDYHCSIQYSDKETYDKLTDKNWMETQHHNDEKTLTKISSELDVAQSTVGLHMKKLNVEILTRRSSQCEREIVDFIKTLTNEHIQTNNKQVIKPYELDIYFPDRKLAIELDGIFWHSESQGKDKKYHLQKTTLCNEKNIRLIHVWDFEWINKTDIVKSRISSVLNVNKTIAARKCEIRSVGSMDADTFFSRTHMQSTAPASVIYGLFYEDSLVACMSFGKPRYNKQYQWELIRYSSERYSTVIGGASKLFKHFLRQHNPNSIITYSDKRWNTGNLYSQLEFRFDHSASPNYYYFNPREQSKMWHRSHFQKHKLANKLEIFDPNLTEWENMKLNGYDRIWDCGNDVYVYDEKSSLKVNIVSASN